MRADHLKGWLVEAWTEEAGAAKVTVTAVEGAVAEIVGPGGGGGMEEKREMGAEAMTHWDKVVALARADFGEEHLEEENMCQVVVLIPKGKG